MEFFAVCRTWLFNSPFRTVLSNRGGSNWLQAVRRIAFGILTFLPIQHVCAAPSERVDGLPDVVVNVATDDANYRYVLHNGNLAEMPNGCLPQNDPCEAPNAMRSLLAQRDSVAAEAEKNRNVLPKGVEWALFSNAKKLVVYGFEKVFGSRSLSLVVAKPGEQRVVYSADDPEVRINCIRWLSDATLAILESKSRSSLTPIGIFGALSGHGIPVTRYTLRIVSFDSDEKASVVKFPLLRSFDDSVACLDMSE